MFVWRSLLLSLLVTVGCGGSALGAVSPNQAVQGVMDGDVDAVERALDQGKDVNGFVPDPGDPASSLTLLHLAAIHDHPEVAQLLVDTGADVNRTDPGYGNTPLHTAARYDHVEVARVLVLAGADLSLKNEEGLTASERADNLGSSKIIAALPKLQKEREALLAKQEAERARDEADEQFAETQKVGTADAYLAFLREHPNSRRGDDAARALIALVEGSDEVAKTAVYEELAETYPEGLDHLPVEVRVLYVGPPGMRVQQIRALSRELGIAVIAARVRSSQEGYKAFTLEELAVLKKLGIHDEIVTAMIEVTTKVQERQKAEAANQELRAEIAALKAMVESSKDAGAADPKPSGKTVKTKDGPMDMAMSCAKRLAALKLCEQIPFPGSSICKSTAESGFPCVK